MSQNITKQERRRRQKQSQKDKAAAAANQQQHQPAMKLNNPVRRKKVRPAHAKAIRNVRQAFNAMTIDGLEAQQGMRLCQQMAMPCVRPTVRMPTMNMTSTAVASFRYTDSMEVSNDVSVDGFAPGGMVFIAYGQPALTYMNGPVKVGATTTYVLRYGVDDALTYTPDISAGGPVSSSANYDFDSYLPITSLVHQYGEEHKGVVQSVGRANGVNYFFISKGEKIALRTAVSVGAGYHCDVEFYNGPSTTNSIAGELTWDTTTAVGAVLFEAARSGHYTVKIKRVFVGGTSSGGTGTSQPIGLSLVAEAGKGVWDLHRVSDACGPTGDKFIGQKVRRTGFSLLVTNTTNALQKQGNVVAGRMQHETVNNVTETALSMVADRYTGQAAKGCYTYMDFTQEAEVFEDCVDGANGQSFVYNLLRTDLIHVMSFAGLSKSGTDAVPSLLATCDISLEFITDSQRYDRATPAFSANALAEARRINNSTSYFYENPLHPQDIMRYLTSAWKGFRSQSNNIARGVAAAYPQYAPIALPLGRLLQT